MMQARRDKKRALLIKAFIALESLHWKFEDYEPLQEQAYQELKKYLNA